MSVERLLIDLVVILLAAKLGSELAERVRQPGVLGELLAGIVVGTSVLGASACLPLVGHPLSRLAIDGQNDFLRLFAEVGALLLLFQSGLESDIEDLKRLGVAALWVAVAGVVLPFAMGFGVARLLGFVPMTAVFLGAALTATSVGITARTFADIGMSRRSEAKIVLGAAVADDVLGLIVLAVVTGIAASTGVATLPGGGTALSTEPTRSPLAIVAFALLFLVGSLAAGIYGAPYILRAVSRMRTRAALATAALVLCFLMAALAHSIGGLAPIVGAYAAGLVLSTTEHKLHFEERIKPLADLFIPIFFVLMGAAMPVAALDPTSPGGRHTIVVALALSAVAIVGKVLGGATVPVKGVSRTLVGFGMVPRGEVGLIFASVGLSHHLIAPSEYTAIVFVVLITTFATPLTLKAIASAEAARRRRLLLDRPGEASRLASGVPVMAVHHAAPNGMRQP